MAMTAKFAFILLYSNAVFIFSSCSPDFTIPRAGFRIVAEDSVMIEKGASKKINIRILRAKGLVNKDVRMEISSLLPEGVAVDFEPDVGDFKVSKAIIHVGPSAKADSYFIILSGTIQSETKGRILKLIVSETAPSIMHQPLN
jgi:hypothetical protein